MFFDGAHNVHPLAAAHHLALFAYCSHRSADFHGLEPSDYSAARPIIRAHLYHNRIPGQNADVVETHLTREVREHLRMVFKTHTERGRRQRFLHDAAVGNDVFSRHTEWLMTEKKAVYARSM